MTIELGELELEDRRLGPELGALFGLEPDTDAETITRVLLMDGQRGSWMRDVVNPGFELPPRARMSRMLERGDMVLDVLLDQGIPVAYTRAHIFARVLTRRDRVGKALDVSETLAAIEIDHVTSTAEGITRDAFGRRIPAQQHRPARDALARGPAAGARDRPSGPGPRGLLTLYKFAQSGDIVAARRAAWPAPQRPPEEDA